MLDDAKAKRVVAKAINLQQLAVEVGFDPLYDTIYRQFSGHAAHPSVASTERHVVRGDGEKIDRLRFSPQRDGIEQTFSAAVFAMLCAMEAISVVFSRPDIKTAVEFHNSNHLVLATGLMPQ